MYRSVCVCMCAVSLEALRGFHAIPRVRVCACARTCEHVHASILFSSTTLIISVYLATLLSSLLQNM